MSATAKQIKETKKVLPDGWRWVKLGEVCEFQYGSSLIEKARQSGLVQVYGSNGVVGYHDTPLTSGPTIIIGRKGSVGQVHYSAIPCYPIDTTYFIDSVKQPIDLRWLSHILQLLGLPQLNKASGVPGLNRSDAYKLEIPIPPLQEQNCITAILQEQMAAVEKARAAARERLEAVKALSAAFLRQVLPQPGQPLPVGWRLTSLGEVIEIVSGQVDPKEAQYRDLPHVNGENIESGTGRLIEVRSAAEDQMISGKYLFEPGVVLYSKLRPYLKKAVIADFQGLCSADMYPILPKANNLNLSFLLALLLSEPFTRYAESHSQRARMPKLNRDQLLAYATPLPPLADQKRIAALLKDQMAAVDKARAAAEVELETINALPAALLRRAFNGEL